MTSTRVIDKERGPREAACPRCGSDAEWAFLAPDHREVEVTCPECGRFAISRAEFVQAETEHAEGGVADEPR